VFSRLTFPTHTVQKLPSGFSLQRLTPSLAPPIAPGPRPQEAPPPRKRMWASGSRKRASTVDPESLGAEAKRRAEPAMAEKFDHLEEHLEKFVENIRQLGIIVSDFQPSSQAGLSQKL
jgi:hypothetical protein